MGSMRLGILVIHVYTAIALLNIHNDNKKQMPKLTMKLLEKKRYRSRLKENSENLFSLTIEPCVSKQNNLEWFVYKILF